MEKFIHNVDLYQVVLLGGKKYFDTWIYYTEDIVFVALIGLLLWSLQMLVGSLQLLIKGQGPNLQLSSG